MGDVILQASSPFNQDSADVVLRSSDQVQFKVHSVILAQASPFFRSMFTLPQPEHPATAIPVVDCDEDSRVLRDILTICYPVVNPKPYPFYDIENTFRAAQKYEMELPIQFLKDELCAELRLSRGTSSLEVWAMACRLQCEDVAAYSSHWINLSQIKTAPTLVFKGVSAGDLFRLRQYYQDGQTLPSLSYSFLKHPAGSSTSDASLPESTSAAQTEMEAVPQDASVEGIAHPDVICRSLDGIDFPAHRAVLAIASPVLRDMLQKMEPLLQPESGSPSQGASTPVLRFDERGARVKHLLDICCYHRTVPIPTSPAELASVIAAATKYDMTHALETLRPHWAAAASKSPLTAYLCATAEDIPAWAMETIPHLLCLPATKVQEYDSAMETAPATQYHRLLKHYDACGSAVVAELEKLKKEHANPVVPPQSSSSTPRSGGFFGNTTPVNTAFGLGSEFGNEFNLPGGFSSVNNAGQQAPSAFGRPPSSSFGQQPWAHPPPDFSKYFVLKFLDKLAKSTAMGPGRKVVTAKNISRGYVEWRSAGKPSPQDPLAEAKTILKLSDSLPKRLEDAMKTVVLDLSSDF